MTSNLVVRGAKASTVFSLLGNDENAATFALGWSLSQSDELLATLLSHVDLAIPNEPIRIELQRHADDGGFTDIELFVAGKLHVILEAKVGGAVAGTNQLGRYRPRFTGNGTGQLFISLSAAPSYAAAMTLPPLIDDVPVIHISWNDIRQLARKAVKAVTNPSERRWLQDLDSYLEGFVAEQVINSNLVYVVALSEEEIAPGYSWISVVEDDSAYFHPIGRGGWPVTPPNYLGFRYRGILQSVHHVDNAELVSKLGERNPKWEQWTDHMLYRLGPPIRPAQLLRSGNIRNARYFCAIDLLLSGACETVKEAQAKTATRQGR